MDVFFSRQFTFLFLCICRTSDMQSSTIALKQNLDIPIIPSIISFLICTQSSLLMGLDPSLTGVAETVRFLPYVAIASRTVVQQY